MQRHQGMTVIEMVCSIALITTLLATVLTSFVSGQAMFVTNEAVLQAHQSAERAMNVIESDLAMSQVRSYTSTLGGLTGTGKTYVKFRRMDPGIVLSTDPSNPLDAFPIWEPMSQMRMYIWCAGEFYMPKSPCNHIVADPQGRWPRSGQLLLVRAAAGNNLGENSGNWVLDTSGPGGGIIAQNVSRFTVRLLDPAGVVINRDAVVGSACTVPSEGYPMSDGEGCVNLANNPFAIRTPVVRNLPVYLGVEFTVQAFSSRGNLAAGADRVLSPIMRRRVALRNRQDIPL